MAADAQRDETGKDGPCHPDGHRFTNACALTNAWRAQSGGCHPGADGQENKDRVHGSPSEVAGPT